MRILFFVHRYWPCVGGVEKYIHQLSRALMSMGHHVDVVTGAYMENLPALDVYEGVNIHRYPALRSPLRCRLMLWRMLLLFSRADVIHVSNTHMLEYYWRMLGFLCDRRKVFLTRHGMSYRYPVPEKEKARARRSLDLAAGFIHDGEFIEKWLEVKPDLCPDQGLFPKADDLEPVPEPEPISACFIGRLEPDSGIRIYLDAVRRLNRDYGKPFRLHVYGDGSLMPELRAKVAEENVPVILHGQELGAQSHIVESCFAFIDGRMAVQEAMARRRLVLAAYPDPLKRDYIAGEPFSPYLIAAGDGEQLAERTAYYIDHPQERASLVERAFQHARTLTWERTACAYLRFWEECLSRPRAVVPWLGSVRLALTLGYEARPVT